VRLASLEQRIPKETLEYVRLLLTTTLLLLALPLLVFHFLDNPREAGHHLATGGLV